MDRVPLLVATIGALKGQRFVVTADGLTIGRGVDCEVMIDDKGISRVHARVLLHNAAVWVQDAGSRNGVFVNGKRITRHKQLNPAAELRVGEHAFTIELGSVPEADPAPPRARPRLHGDSAMTLAPEEGVGGEAPAVPSAVAARQMEEDATHEVRVVADLVTEVPPPRAGIPRWLVVGLLLLVSLVGLALVLRR